MDKMIQEIISLDHKRTQELEEAKRKKSDTNANMNARKKEIYDEFVNEYQKTLDEKKHELQSSIEETKKKNEEDYLSQVESLSSYYKAHKDEWIQTIVERCKE